MSGTAGFRFFHITDDFLEMLARDQRTHLCFRIEWIAHTNRTSSRLKRFNKLIVDGALYENACSVRTHLTGRIEVTRHRRIHCVVDVGVIKDR